MLESPDLAHLIRQQAQVDAVCQAPKCRHAARLNLSSLASRLGSKVTLAEIEPKVRCETCRGKKVRLRLM